MSGGPYSSQKLKITVYSNSVRSIYFRIVREDS